MFTRVVLKKLILNFLLANPLKVSYPFGEKINHAKYFSKFLLFIGSSSLLHFTREAK